jgi:hypothetical protein
MSIANMQSNYMPNTMPSNMPNNNMPNNNMPNIMPNVDPRDPRFQFMGSPLPQPGNAIPIVLSQPRGPLANNQMPDVTQVLC